MLQLIGSRWHANILLHVKKRFSSKRTEPVLLQVAKTEKQSENESFVENSDTRRHSKRGLRRESLTLVDAGWCDPERMYRVAADDMTPCGVV